MELSEAVGILKKFAAQFAAFQQVAEACDATVHAQGAVASAKNDLENVKKSHADFLKSAEADKARIAAEVAVEKKSLQDTLEARDASNKAEEAKALQVVEICNAKVAAARAAVPAAEADAQATLADIRIRLLAEKEKLTKDHDAFMQAMKAEQEKITFATSQLKTHLDELKSKFSPLLA